MYKLALVTISLFLASSIIAQEVRSFTIEEAKAYALENNLSVHNANNDIEIARKKIVETRGIGLPQVNINGNFNHFINLPVTVIDAKFLNPMAEDGETVSFEAGTKYTSNGSLEVGQILFNGSYIVGLQAASFFAKFQETVSNQTKEDVAFNVIQAYELAAIAKENKSFMDSLVASTTQLVQKQQNFLELGLMLQEDMDQLSYSLLGAKNAQLSADLQYENALNMLKLAMGYPISSQIEVNNTTSNLMSKTSITTGDIKSNLTYMMMERQVKLSELNVKNNKFANLPTLNAFFSQTYNAFRTEFNFFDDERWFPQTVWGLQLNIPVFSGLSRHARTAQTKIQLLSDQNNLSMMEQNLQFQEIQFQNNYQAAIDKTELQKQNVELAKNIYNNEIIRENIGKGNSINVTQKHTQYMTAQAQYIGSLVELFQAKLALDKLYNNILPSK
ncbi:MAG: TolC family protein [Crocinitomicaceae bacterium]|nr:TolC family protein [Crocinitomicaceae bacterium]